MTPRQARRRLDLGADIFTGLVIASIGLELAHLTWRLVGYSGVGPAVAPAVPALSRGIDIRPVIALAPFGSAAAAPATTGAGPIRLRAIFLAVPAAASTVLIASADGKVASYSLGQSVGDGVIETIEPEQIVLRTAGGTRTMALTQVAAPPGVLVASDGGPPAKNAPPAGSSQGPARASGSSSGADAVRALIPPEFQGAAAAPPPPTSARATSPGAMGYVVGASPDPAILAAGIRPGDVIERVNGQPVNAGSNQRTLIAQAAASGSARLDIVRDGQRLSLTVPVR